MKSIQTKMVFVILCCTLMTTLAVLAVGYFNFSKTRDEDSAIIMNLICEKEVEKIEKTINEIEQRVNILYNFSTEQMGDNPKRWGESEYMEECLNKIKDVSLNVASNTDSALSVYVCFDPELAPSTFGFWAVRDSKTGEFETQMLMDNSVWEEEDMGHLYWYYTPMMVGMPVWLHPYDNDKLGEKMISYVMPVHYKDKVVGVVGMDVEMELLREVVSAISVYETGYAFLLDSAENIIYHKEFPQGALREDLPDQMQETLSCMKQDLGTDALCSQRSFNIDKQMVSRKLSNDMYLVIAVPDEEIETPIRKFTINSILFSGILVMLLLGIVIWWVRVLVRPLKELSNAAKEIGKGNMDVEITCKSKDEVGVLAQNFRQTVQYLKGYIAYINQLAYADPLTGARSKSAYTERVLYLEEEIASGQADFTVVLMDINDLKKMNDTFGHEKGDALIRDAFRVMSKVFGDQEIYRIGGDEFVVLLYKEAQEQFKNWKQLLTEEMYRFNTEEEKSYEDCIQIAAGMARYAPKLDAAFADVFRRADEMMYKDKKQLKEEKQP